MKRILTVLTLICASLLLASSAAKAQESLGGTKYSLFANFGFGFANNIRMADRLNGSSDYLEGAWGTPAEKKEPIGYAGFDLEPHIFFEKLVLAPSWGYYNVSKGERDLTHPNGTTYHEELDLKMTGLKLSLYYRIGVSETSFVLLGGGLGYYRGTMTEKYGYNGNLESNSST